ncbi:pupal cuticle protein-like [Leptopilina boulardi]|uniref:pupal cuticle protein-like n=1 Tax=Leptopilina boulardi TaxID=63433 RepID=UPI0021F5BEB9|nr:pupal cuticle protein-like [Leptopilina boulardi]
MFALILSCAIIAASQAEYLGYGNQGPVQQQFAPPAPVGHDGNVIDTPEVQQAKAAHFAEFARAAARAVDDKQQQQQQEQIGYSPEAHRAPQYSQYAHQSAQPVYARQSYPTQPLYHAGANPVAAPSAAAYPQQYDSRANYVASAPRNYAPASSKIQFAPAPLAEDGTVIDTPEVAALKAARLQELAEAEARAYKYNGPDEYSDDGQAYNGQKGISSPLNYGAASPYAASAPGHFGASGPVPRVYPGPTAYQGFAAAPYGKSFQPSAFQPQSFQSQQQHAY